MLRPGAMSPAVQPDGTGMMPFGRSTGAGLPGRLGGPDGITWPSGAGRMLVRIVRGRTRPPRRWTGHWQPRAAAQRLGVSRRSLIRAALPRSFRR
jgi:hypothetical protein